METIIVVAAGEQFVHIEVEADLEHRWSDRDQVEFSTPITVTNTLSAIRCALGKAPINHALKSYTSSGRQWKFIFEKVR